MREFTFDFGSKPKKYVFDSVDALTGTRPVLRFGGLRESLALAGDLQGKLMSVPAPFVPADEDAYKITTAVELLQQTYGKPFTLVCPVDDGGALLRGCSATLKAFNEEIRVVAVTLDGARTEDALTADSHFDVTGEQARETASLALEKDGVRLGDGAAAVLFAAANVAAEAAEADRTVLAILKDAGPADRTAD